MESSAYPGKCAKCLLVCVEAMVQFRRSQAAPRVPAELGCLLPRRSAGCGGTGAEEVSVRPEEGRARERRGLPGRVGRGRRQRGSRDNRGAGHVQVTCLVAGKALSGGAEMTQMGSWYCIQTEV